MKKFIKFVLFLALVAGGGYYFYDKNFNVPQVDQFITSKVVRGELIKVSKVTAKSTPRS